MAINFLPERLRMLIECSGTSVRQLAVAIGISYQTINAVLYRPEYKIGLDSLLNISELFDIPLDYFFDRCSDKQAQKILEGDVTYVRFQQIRRMSYEDCIASGKIKNKTLQDDKYEAPWPYNLAEDIFREPINWIITDERLSNFEESIDKNNWITSREKEYVFGYYRNGKTLAGLGRKHGIGKERVRQIIVRAIRRLSTPAIANLLCNNFEIMEKKRLELETKIKQLETTRDILEKDIETLRETKDETEKEMISNSLLALRGDMTVSEMDLSIRAHNCLTRAGCHTLKDVVDVANNDELLKIRNLGVNTRKEILDKIEELTGLTFAVKTEHNMIQL